MNRFVLLSLVLAVGTGFAEDRPWTRHTIDDSSRGADGVRLADVDGDGDQDIATGWEEGGLVRVYLNPGPAKAREPWPAVTVGRVKSPEDAVFVDLDGDGATDVVSSCEGRTRMIFVHWAPRERERYLEPAAWETAVLPHSEGFAQWMFCLPMQFDGERGPDLVVGSKGANAAVGWYESPENPRDLAAWKWHRLTDAGWIMSLQRDTTRSAEPSVLYTDRKGANRGVWTIGRGGERTSLGAHDREVMFLGREPSAVASPGVPSATYAKRPLQRDVLTAVRGRGITWLQWDSGFGKWGETEIPLPPNTGTGKGVAATDVNLDGRWDVVFTCENAGGGKHGAMWLERLPGDRGVPRWQPHPISGTKQGVKFDRIEMLDLDGDGDADLLTCEERDNLGVIWYENPTR